MPFLFKILLACVVLTSCLKLTGQSKLLYLKSNCIGLRDSSTSVDLASPKMIGFGAYHGSAKTETAELLLIQKIHKQSKIEIYFPETDFSTAVYFSKYLRSGDTLLLNRLVHAHGSRVPQERSKQFRDKWKALRALYTNPNWDFKPIIVGIDAIADYRFVVELLLQLRNENPWMQNFESIKNLKAFSQQVTYSFRVGHSPELTGILKNIVKDLEQQKALSFTLDRIVEDLKVSFASYDRTEALYKNYLKSFEFYQLRKKVQFFRFGFSHLLKAPELTEGLFSKVLNDRPYKKEEVISIIGYFNKSEVLWNTYYDQGGKYHSHNIEKGYGIGDYWLEYFRGIRKLKKSSTSDLDLFNLNATGTPYQNKPDLIQVKMLLKKSNKKWVRGKSTTQFIDYALLINKSAASEPLGF